MWNIVSLNIITLFASFYCVLCQIGIPPQQAELFQAGVKRIEIQMEPYWFSHEWEEDELGSKLYERYAESKTHRLIKK